MVPTSRGTLNVVDVGVDLWMVGHAWPPQVRNLAASLAKVEQWLR